MSPKKSIEISFVTPGSRGFSVFAHGFFSDNTTRLHVPMACNHGMSSNNPSLGRVHGVQNALIQARRPLASAQTAQSPLKSATESLMQSTVRV